MGKCNFKLPGIRHIYMLQCSLLPVDMMAKSIAGIPIAILTDKHEDVPFFGTPKVEYSTEYQNGGYVQTTKLTLRSSITLPRHCPMAFIVHCNDGSRWVIGTRERPYPVVNSSGTTGEPDGESAVTEYEITLVAVKSLIELQM